MKKNQRIFIGILGLSFAGCAASSIHTKRNPATDGTFTQLKGTYDAIYPLYAIECASSKFDEKDDAPGGPYGHTFMYLKGACRDRSPGINYPKIKVCDPGTDLSNPESGVGLALDKNFSSTRYIATDGFNFLINGDLSDDAPLNTPAFEAAVKKVVADGDADGIILTDSALRDKIPYAKKHNLNPNMSAEEWVAREVIGSSFAVDFARNLACITVPINQEMLEAAVKEVNEQNEPFVSGKKKFKWSGISDQCVQFVNNVFAAMGIGKNITTSNNPVRKVWDLITQLVPFVPSQMPAPVNHLLTEEAKTNGGKMFSLEQAYADETIRTNFNTFHRLPASDGVLMWTQAAHSNENAYFNTQATLEAVDLPIVTPNARTYKRLTEMPSVTELVENLKAFQLKLQKAIDEMTIDSVSIESSLYCDKATEKNEKSGDTDFKTFCQKYTDYMLRSKKEVSSRLSGLN